MLTPRPIRGAVLLGLSTFTVALLCGCGPSGSTPPPPDSDVDGVSAIFDCDDSNPSITGMQTYFVDMDEDGVGGSITEGLCAMTAPSAYSVMSGDCDDTDPRIQAEITYWVDGDQDGVGGTQGASLCESVAPAGFSDDTGDCDDGDATLTDGVAYYVDADLDGYGAGVPTVICSNMIPAGMVTNSDDPDDQDPDAVPEDFDGDGYANSNDCAPTDASAYVLNSYYEDVDGDGLGSGEVEICGPLPVPELPGYVSNDLDDCPRTFNRGRDFDDDDLDDVCDAEIHLRRSRTLTEDVEFPATLERGAVPIDYRFGDDGRPIEVRFRGADLELEDCVSVTIAGGSSLVFETLDSADYAALEMGSPRGHSSNCETSIRGENASDSSRLNRVEFQAARILAGSRARFRALNQVIFGSKTIPNASNQSVEHGSDILLQRGFFDLWRDDEFPTFTGFSRAEAAVLVDDQYLDLTDIRFVGHDEYPLECVDRDYRLLEGTSVRGARDSRTTCQTAINLSYFSGNGREGPLLSTIHGYESDLGPPDVFDDRSDSGFIGNTGTDTFYVRRMTIASESDQADSTTFNDVDVLPYTYRDPQHAGDGSPDDLIAEDVEIRIGSVSGSGPNVFLTRTKISDVPIVVIGESVLDVDDSELGPILIKTDEGPSGPGPSVFIQKTDLDFRGSAFLQLVRTPGAPGGDATAGIVFDNFGPRLPGYLEIEDSDFQLNRSIDDAILVLSSQDPEDFISIDDQSLPRRTDFEDLIRVQQNDCCSITPYFGLK
jgi:hypothetical protein